MQKHLTKGSKSGYYNATTKLLTAQPSRHTLAIFMPAKGITCYNNSYGGLIGANIIPKGNNPSRLVAVVETCHPFCRVGNLTKLLGVTNNGY